MPYTSNPYAPKARMQARNDVVWGRLTVQQAADKYGVNRSTIWRWIKKAKQMHLNGNTYIWTESSAPHRHPNMLKPKVVDRILALRKQLKRCAPVIQEHLVREGYKVSLSSVERTLRRLDLVRKKKQARFYTPLPKPSVLVPGAFVQMDTIHFVKTDGSRFYVYALIDVYSRLAYAEYQPKLSQQTSVAVLLRANTLLKFPFRMVQTDNGPEFRDGFLGALTRQKIQLRHSRICKPNDNAHIERFNRTLQDECFSGKLPNEATIREELQRYIDYYNHDRLHLGLQLQTPTEFVAKVLT